MSAHLQLAIMAMLEKVDDEEALASLAACKNRIYYRALQRAHLAPQADGLGKHYTVRETAVLLGVSEKFVRSHQSQLRAVRVGRAVRIPEAGIKAFLSDPSE